MTDYADALARRNSGCSVGTRGSDVMGEFAHGISGYTNGYCRCDVCTEANRRRHKRWREERRAARVLVDGRLIAPLPEECHGKPDTYGNHSCRCRECVRAWVERGVPRTRKWRQKRRDAA